MNLFWKSLVNGTFQFCLSLVIHSVSLVDMEIVVEASETVAKLLFVVGVLVYLVRLWILCPPLSEKGYFLDVSMTATFSNYAYLRAGKLGRLDDFFTRVCQLVTLIVIGLLFIGVLNALINIYEMVIYPIASFVCLFDQMRLFRSA